MWAWTHTPQFPIPTQIDGQNGNLINTSELLQFMDAVAHRHINTSSDSELLLNIFADNLNDTGKFRINEEDIFVAIRRLMTQARGAYACVAMLAGFGIIAFRDPNGIRPLGVACRATPSGARDWLCASESAVADVAGFVDWEDVRPGTPKLYLRERIQFRGWWYWFYYDVFEARR
jgi:amidophosphoribosyltransferase